MHKFAVEYVRQIDDGALPIRLGVIADACGINVATVSAWRHHTPGFNEWLSQQLMSYVAREWPVVKAVAVKLAKRGSIAHMNFLLQLMEPSLRKGAEGLPPPAPAGPFAGAVIVNLPQPPSELEGHTVVRGLLDLATVIDTTATPA